jgi:beta-glucosidase-like glycosyl hydrolase
MNTDTQSKTKPRDSVLAHFMLGFQGDSLPPELAEYLAQGLAGVVIYQRNFASVEQLLQLTAAIIEAAGRPVLIGIDQEGGTRLENRLHSGHRPRKLENQETLKPRKKSLARWPRSFAQRDAILILLPCWTCM